MPRPQDKLPVKAWNNEILYYVSIPTAERLVESRRAIAVGTKKRVRSHPGKGHGHLDWLKA